MKLQTKSDTHWYTRVGVPAYDADMRRARKENLVPSVTTIWGNTIRNYAIDLYVKSQLLYAASTFPNPQELSGELLCQAWLTDSEEHAKKAREFGTSIHEALEGFFRGQPIAEPLKKFTDPVLKYLSDEKIRPLEIEKSFCCPKNLYGGKIDLIAEKNNKLIVIDFKTKATKGEKIKFYDDYLIQLVAYHRGITFPQHFEQELMSIVISSDEPGKYLSKTYQPNDEDSQDAWECFLSAFRIWKRKNKWNKVVDVKQEVMVA